MSRFWNSFYISNVCLLLLYFPIRYSVGSPQDMIISDDFLPSSVSKNREFQVLVTGTMVLFVKALRCQTCESFAMTFFFFYKCCFTIVLFFSNIWAMFWYLNFCLIVWMLFKMPFYEAKNKFIDMNTVSQFENDVLKGDSHWVLLFYSPINSDCIGTMSCWADLSNNYTTNKLKFAKINVDKAVFLAQKCNVDGNSYSKQLPSLILYGEGKELKRYPPVGKNGELPTSFNYKVKMIVKYMGIDRIYVSTKHSE